MTEDRLVEDRLVEDTLTEQEVENELDDILTTNFQNGMEEASTDNDDSEFDESIETTIEYDDSVKGDQKEITASDVLDGALLLTMIDLILPELCVFIFNKYVRKGDMKKATSAKIKLKQTQINQLKPLADAMLKEMNVKGNPTILFGFALLSIYAMNLIHLATPK